MSSNKPTFCTESCTRGHEVADDPPTAWCRHRDIKLEGQITYCFLLKDQIGQDANQKVKGGKLLQQVVGC